MFKNSVHNTLTDKPKKNAKLHIKFIYKVFFTDMYSKELHKIKDWEYLIVIIIYLNAFCLYIV